MKVASACPAGGSSLVTEVGTQPSLQGSSLWLDRLICRLVTIGLLWWMSGKSVGEGFGCSEGKEGRKLASYWENCSLAEGIEPTCAHGRLGLERFIFPSVLGLFSTGPQNKGNAVSWPREKMGPVGVIAGKPCRVDHGVLPLRKQAGPGNYRHLLALWTTKNLGVWVCTPN